MSKSESQEEMLTRLLRNEQEGNRRLRARVEQLQDVFLFLQPLARTEPISENPSGVPHCIYCHSYNEREAWEGFRVLHLHTCPWFQLEVAIRTKEPEK